MERGWERIRVIRAEVSPEAHDTSPLGMLCLVQAAPLLRVRKDFFLRSMPAIGRGSGLDFDFDVSRERHGFMVHTAFGGGDVLVVGMLRGLGFDEQSLEALVLRQAMTDFALE